MSRAATAMTNGFPYPVVPFHVAISAAELHQRRRAGEEITVGRLARA